MMAWIHEVHDFTAITAGAPVDLRNLELRMHMASTPRTWREFSINFAPKRAYLTLAKGRASGNSNHRQIYLYLMTVQN